jgi:HAD superfamily hydrolase (TIGR01548 family)
VKDLLIFDMDGVLVEVTESYRATIQQTVKHFTGYEPSRAEIQDWKNRGGWNDDWLLSHRMVLERGHNIDYQTVVDRFQQIFHGDQHREGLILREVWVAPDGLFDRLAANHKLAIFTGRLRWEARVTLDRFAPNRFDPIVCCDDVARPKPDPEGLHKICSAIAHGKCWYVGDTVDDARAAQAAGIPFVGIAARTNPRYAELVEVLRAHRAITVLDDINSLEAAIASNR